MADLPFFSQNRTKKHQAAILLAEDQLTDEAIAEAVGVTRRTVAEWKTHPEFLQVIGDYTGAIIGEALKLPIAKKHERISQLNKLNESYWQIINDRAERHAGEVEDTPENAAARMFGDFTPAEAATGMLVKQMKIAANGKTVTEWVFDKALASEIRDTHKQAAQELGQWTEQSKVEMDGGMRIEVVGVSDDEMP